MKKLSLIIATCIICAALVGCQIDATELFKSEDTLTLYIHTGGTAVSKKEIMKDSHIYNELRDWFLKNEKGWSSSLVTYRNL
jgi:hypothetical protein